MKFRKRVSLLVLLLFMLSMVLGGCGGRGQQPSGVTPAVDGTGGGSAEFAMLRTQAFADPGPEYVKDFTPSVPAYKVAKDFSNVVNWEQFDEQFFSEEQKALLRQNGFVVTDGYWEEFSTVYEVNRYGSMPNFVTTDAMLHTYHLYFSRILKSVEKEHFIGALTELNTAMLAASEAQYQALQGTEWENAARRNVAFFAVGRALLGPATSYSPANLPEVGEELALIEAADGIYASPVLNLGADDADAVQLLLEDYTQYIPRSHYASSEELSRYFKTMMWYGRMSMRQSNEDECRSALLMALALQEGDNIKPWQQIYDVT
ncbi:MAG: DUF3160 domain-containing protein, partial [Syntrophomonadaceae bacterium]|nr:DUF3160 domain-containing protein [Syntrophomonadaceae bacterium]